MSKGLIICCFWCLCVHIICYWRLSDVVFFLFLLFEILFGSYFQGYIDFLCFVILWLAVLVVPSVFLLFAFAVTIIFMVGELFSMGVFRFQIPLYITLDRVNQTAKLRNQMCCVYGGVKVVVYMVGESFCFFLYCVVRWFGIFIYNLFVCLYGTIV